MGNSSIDNLNKFTLEEHYALFTEFCGLEKKSGGPDPQVDTICCLSASQTIVETLWLIGCYAATHCIPTAYTIWNTWRPDNIDSYSLMNWLNIKWKYLPIRPERKSVYIKEHMVLCLSDFANYALTRADIVESMSYDELWEDSIRNIRYYNRYMAIKYIEMLKRARFSHLDMPDIRPKSAWSPRLMLGTLYPKYYDYMIAKRETQYILDVSDELSKRTVSMLNDKGVSVNLFEVQVLLCEYREAVNGGFYAGCTHDEEMKYIKRAEEGFPGTFSKLYETRKELFDDRLLGEIRGWDGIRKELGKTIMKYRYVWSDFKYEYPCDIASPVKYIGREINE